MADSQSRFVNLIVNDLLLASPRQLPNPQPLGPSHSVEDASTLRRRHADNGSSSTGAPLSELPQRAFVYESGDRHVSFLENTAANGAHVTFNDTPYYLAPQSVVIVLTTTTNESRILFNTSDVAVSFPHTHHRVYTPLVDETMLEWQTWSELQQALKRL